MASGVGTLAKLGALLAGGFGGLFAAIFKFFVQWWGVKTTLWSAHAALVAAFATSFLICYGTLWGYVSGMHGGAGASGGGGNYLQYFWIGAGMFIPANAGGILACLFSVWTGCILYSWQRQSLNMLK